MDQNDVLWDALAGMLMIYVDNYLLKKNGGGKLKLQPSYEVNYEISEEIIAELKKTLKGENVSDIWYMKIAGCRNINELPLQFQKLIMQFLPRFYEEYPQYADIDCLRLNTSE